MIIHDPQYRRYAERIVVALARHYSDSSHVIGWQLDNEASAYGPSNASVHKEITSRLRQITGPAGALLAAFPTRDFATSNAHKLGAFPAMSRVGLHSWQPAWYSVTLAPTSSYFK